jgi:peroxiredoxin
MNVFSALAIATLVVTAAALGWSPAAHLPVALYAQSGEVGKLSSELVPNRVRGQVETLKDAAPPDRSALPITLSEGDRLFVGATFFRKDSPVKLMLVEPAKGEPFLFADVNQNGSFESSERFGFQGPNRELVLKLALGTGPFRHYPIRMVLPEPDIYTRDSRGQKTDQARSLLRSPSVFVEGAIDVGGRKTLVRYMFDLNKGDAYPNWGWQGMDTNGDGLIEERANSDEFTFAKDEGVVFSVNGHDVSTVSIDVKSGTFLVRKHVAGDNNRILLRMGDPVPNFSFTDLDGKSRQYSEFQGKFVLLSFWGTWCAPCVQQLPDLERAYQKFRPRGFVILGMGDDKEMDKARKVLADAGVTYPQSGGEAGNDLVYKRFRINRFPTKVLIGPDGKVIAVDNDGSLDRERLASTLDKLLPGFVQ